MTTEIPGRSFLSTAARTAGAFVLALFGFSGAALDLFGVSGDALAQEPSLEEVLDRHRAALGGEGVHTLRMEGTYTAFSEPGPFTLELAHPNLSRFSFESPKFPVTTGYDGEDSWLINPLFGFPHAIPSPMVDGSLAAMESLYPNPLLADASSGIELDFHGVEDFEGEETYKITARLPSGDGDEGVEETWYLSTETALAVARTHTSSDFGRAMPGATYYMDYRTVEGITLPHRVETEFGTRHRVMELDRVELNPELAKGHFAFPAPPGMGDLQAMVGTWDVKVETFRAPGAPPQESPGTSTIDAPLHGGILVEDLRFQTFGTLLTARITRAYDAEHERYQETSINSFTFDQDVYRGTMEDGVLTTTDLETGTAGESQGQPSYTRRKLYDLSRDGFKVELEQSTDGEEWNLRTRYTYSRPDTESGDEPDS